MPLVALDAWKNARRTEHLNLGALHPRLYGQPDPALKAFDVPVQQYHAANNLHDRLTHLGDIIRSGALYLLGGPSAARAAAVNGLIASAQAELAARTAGLPINAHQAALEAVAFTAAAPFKDIHANIVLVRDAALNDPLLGYALEIAAADPLINTHIANANAVLAQARIRVVRNGGTVAIDAHGGHSILTPALPYIPPVDVGSFSDHGRDLLSGYLNGAGGAPTDVDIVYVPRFAAALLAQGVTTRP